MKLVAAALLAAACSSSSRSVPPETTDAGSIMPAPQPFLGGDWPQYRHDIRGSFTNPGTFTAADAGRLHILWSVPLGQYGYSQPILVGDAIYVDMGAVGRTIALDRATGAVRWTTTLDHVLTPACLGAPFQAGIWGAPAFAGGVLYVPSPDGNVYALDAPSGAVLWHAQVATPELEFVESSPAVSPTLGKLYVGVSSSAGCDPAVGKVVSVDLVTHAVTAIVLTDGRPGSSVWSSIAIDEPNRVIWAATGDPTPAYTIADEPLSDSLVELDALTLAPIASWQDPSTMPDSDFGASPVIFSAGDGTPLVADEGKDGRLFLLDRRRPTAGPTTTFEISAGGDPIAMSGGLGSLVSPTFDSVRLFAAGGQTPDGSAPGQIVAFDVSMPTAGLVWRHPTAGYVLAGMPAVGDILVAAEIAPGNGSATVEILNRATGLTLRSFPDSSAIFGAPVAGNGVILWIDFQGQMTALSAE